jgi:hypothetical protein
MPLALSSMPSGFPSMAFQLRSMAFQLASLAFQLPTSAFQLPASAFQLPTFAFRLPTFAKPVVGRDILTFTRISGFGPSCADSGPRRTGGSRKNRKKSRDDSKACNGRARSMDCALVATVRWVVRRPAPSPVSSGIVQGHRGSEACLFLPGHGSILSGCRLATKRQRESVAQTV